MESMTMPGHSVAQPDPKADVVTHLTSYKGTFFLQGLPYGHTNHGLPVESMPQSGGSAGQSGTKADTILAAESIHHRRMSHASPAIPPVVSNPYVNGDVCILVSSFRTPYISRCDYSAIC